MVAVSVDATQGNPDNTQNEIMVEGTLVLTGNYGGGATHGDTLSFANLDEVKSQQVPTRVELYEAPPAGTAPTGYQFNYCPGTTQDNGVLNIMNGAATEYTEGSAYSAPLLAAVLKFKAWFPAFI